MTLPPIAGSNRLDGAIVVMGHSISLLWAELLWRGPMGVFSAGAGGSWTSATVGSGCHDVFCGRPGNFRSSVGVGGRLDGTVTGCGPHDMGLVGGIPPHGWSWGNRRRPLVRNFGVRATGGRPTRNNESWRAAASGFGAFTGGAGWAIAGGRARC